MARPLSGKTNVIAPGGNYPYGRVRDNSGTGNGTNVNENLVGDLIQFFERLLANGGVTANGNPENSADGFQYHTALNAIITALATALVSTEASTRSSADTTLQNNINLKADIASPALTGNPTAPTQSPGTNNTRISTTAYTDAAVAVEAAARGAVDTSLNSAISTEASTRGSADTTLQNNINAIYADATFFRGEQYASGADLNTYAKGTIQHAIGTAANAPVTGSASDEFIVQTVDSVNVNGKIFQTALQIGSVGALAGTIWLRVFTLGSWGAWSVINDPAA